MSVTPKILLAEDDQNLSYLIADQLGEAGFKVSQATDGTSGWQMFTASRFDLCLIDVMMPGMDGFSLAEKIRENNQLVPIIFLTARSLEEDKLRGFEVGGDDYLTKPFSMKELIFRVKVFLRRSEIRSVPHAHNKQIGAFAFDITNLTLTFSGKHINLTQREADLLHLLSSSEGTLVKREDILEKLWGENDYFKGRSLDVFISRLRKYLRNDPNLEIRNHHGVGFVLLNKAN